MVKHKPIQDLVKIESPSLGRPNQYSSAQWYFLLKNCFREYVIQSEDADWQFSLLFTSIIGIGGRHQDIRAASALI